MYSLHLITAYGVAVGLIIIAYPFSLHRPSARSPHEFSAPEIVRWPALGVGVTGYDPTKQNDRQHITNNDMNADVPEEGFSLVHTWHQKRLAFVSMSLSELRTKCTANEPDTMARLT